MQEDGSDAFGADQEIALAHPNGEILAIMRITDRYVPDQGREAQKVYGTTDDAHPGVAAMRAAGPVYLGGSIELVNDVPRDDFSPHKYTPAETRDTFGDRGWDTVVAFQTRNPIHRAHEYLQKCALEMVDGLLVHPLVGETKSDDIPADVRMECYEVLIDKY